MVEITDLAADDIEPILDVVRRTGVFTDDEVLVAREVLDEAALGPDRTTYRALTARVEGRVAGYIHYGETPMTQGCYDLYWMAVDPGLQGRGIGAKLVRAMEDRIRAGGARLVRVETSGLDEYAPTRAFYERIGYPESSRIRDFYWAGNDLCTHVRYL